MDLKPPPNELTVLDSVPPSPSSPSIPSFHDKPKKPNPLTDLFDTEKTYVDLLAGIIRKVAAAWSRSNLPPPELDVMFRSIEGVYKANRALLSKLKDIGTNPSSPKALGDLLMRWIDDLDGPYTTYCTRFRRGFDTWLPVQCNQKLPDILAAFSASNPPAPAATMSLWTLDDLFLLPKARLKYYKKLYGRLLKSTAPGRSDHRLLVGALETLDRLLNTLEAQSSINVANTSPSAPSASAPPGAEDEVVIDSRTQSVVEAHRKQLEVLHPSTDVAPESVGSSPRASSVSGDERLSHETANTSVSRISTDTLGMSLSDLERRLSTQRTIDIFTMNPKVVRLQMRPPSLTFTRELRFSGDVVVRFTSQATGIKVVHMLGHIYLLSDLFLVCEKILPEDQSQPDLKDADMWLCYPPLSGKVLRVSEIHEEPNALKVAIMRKENLVLETESLEARNILMAHFKECIDFAGTIPPPSKQPPPPLPPLNHLSHSIPTVPDRPESTPQSSSIPEPHYSASPPTKRSSSLLTGAMSPRLQPPSVYHGVDTGGRATEGIMSRTALPEGHAETGFQRMSSMHEMSAGQLPLPRIASVAQPYHHGPPGPSLPGLPAHPRAGQFGPATHDPNFPGSRAAPGPHAHQAPFQQPPVSNSQPFPQPPGPPGSPGYFSPGAHPRPPSEPGRMRTSISSRSLASQYSQNQAPPIPPFPGGFPPNGQHLLPRSSSFGNLHAPQPRPVLPSLHLASRAVSMDDPSFDEPSPPNSPVQETPKIAQPVISTISATMKCKVFLQQQHAQWKSLGSAKLKLYRQDPTNIKQLVVEAENKENSVLISTIVLTDGVERVGKTGVAIELSDKGARTGIIYMIQLRNEKSAGGFFDSLLEGSDRVARK